MRTNKYIALLLILLCLCSACEQQELSHAGKDMGALDILLATESEGDFISVLTKSGEEKVSPDSLHVAILNTAGESVVSFDTYKDMKENSGVGLPLTLPVGSYLLKAWHGEAGNSSDKPYIYGEQDFDISYNTVTRVNLTCGYQCFKVMVQTSSAFNSICKDTYKVRLSTDMGESSVLTKNDYWYFFQKECGKITAVIELVTTDGRALSFSYDLTKKDGEPFSWKNSVVVTLDIQGTKSIQLETEIK